MLELLLVVVIISTIDASMLEEFGLQTMLSRLRRLIFWGDYGIMNTTTLRKRKSLLSDRTINAINVCLGMVLTNSTAI